MLLLALKYARIYARFTQVASRLNRPKSVYHFDWLVDNLDVSLWYCNTFKKNWHVTAKEINGYAVIDKNLAFQFILDFSLAFIQPPQWYLSIEDPESVW
jgi:hypothetical protein